MDANLTDKETYVDAALAADIVDD